MDDTTAIILAAGKGTRLKSKGVNKVTHEVGGKPMLVKGIENLRSAGIKSFVVVVGFAKESVLVLLDKDIIIAEQNIRLGTAHATKVGLAVVPKESENVLILYGDDAFFHSPETFKNLYKTHKDTKATLTFITMDMDNPTGYGRIKRDENGEIVGIIEEKNASENEKTIKEINLGCFLVSKEFLEKNIKRIKKNSASKEYYITDIIDIIAKDNKKIAGYKLKNANWQGVNTKEDLEKARSFFK